MRPKRWKFRISTQDKILPCRLKSTDDNNRKMPGLVRQIWVICPDKNSYHGKLWERKHFLLHMPAQAVGTAFTLCGYLGLGLYKNVSSSFPTEKTRRRRPDEMLQECRWWYLLFTHSLLLFSPSPLSLLLPYLFFSPSLLFLSSLPALLPHIYC